MLRYRLINAIFFYYNAGTSITGTVPENVKIVFPEHDPCDL